MQNDPSVELHVCFKRSYDEVLKHHHTFIVRSLAIVRQFLLFCAAVGALGFVSLPAVLIQVAVRAVPYRRDFIARISQGGDREKFFIELAKWLSGLDTIVNRLKVFLEGGGYGRV
ncbi:hypothetical protein JVU11DRAFT_6730 [Chiua virens]|nr:hypothetical protein JVU11DRAFT_6730 [Chiua virens]